MAGPLIFRAEREHTGKRLNIGIAHFALDYEIGA